MIIFPGHIRCLSSVLLGSFHLPSQERREERTEELLDDSRGQYAPLWNSSGCHVHYETNIYLFHSPRSQEER